MLFRTDCDVSTLKCRSQSWPVREIQRAVPRRYLRLRERAALLARLHGWFRIVRLFWITLISDALQAPSCSTRISEAQKTRCCRPCAAASRFHFMGPPQVVLVTWRALPGPQPCCVAVSTGGAARPAVRAFLQYLGGSLPCPRLPLVSLHLGSLGKPLMCVSLGKNPRNREFIFDGERRCYVDAFAALTRIAGLKGSMKTLRASSATAIEQIKPGRRWRTLAIRRPGWRSNIMWIRA